MLSKLYNKYILKSFDRVKIVFAYMKQGWNTYNWDYAYLLDDIVFKLELMKKQFNSDGIMEDEHVKEINDQINEIIKAIKDDRDEIYWIFTDNPKFMNLSLEEKHKVINEENKKAAKNWSKIFELMAKHLPSFWD